MNGDFSKWTQLTDTDNTEAYPAWSPDDRWLAYSSNATGRYEIYVQLYPGPGIALPVSTNGGVAPVWNPQGSELFTLKAAAAVT